MVQFACIFIYRVSNDLCEHIFFIVVHKDNIPTYYYFYAVLISGPSFHITGATTSGHTWASASLYTDTGSAGGHCDAEF